MPTSSPLRKTLSLLLLAAGAAATLATSKDAPELWIYDTVALDPGAAVFFEVHVNEAAMDHVRANPGVDDFLSVQIYGVEGRLVADDREGTWVAFRLDACPESGGCVVGITAESLDTTEGTATIEVRVRAATEFPPDSTVTLTFEDE